jgi:hypothetical protein
MPDQHDTSAAATAWLLAEFDLTDLDDIRQNDHGDIRSVYVQPMLRFKSIMAPACAMRITEFDYKHPNRRWL